MVSKNMLGLKALKIINVLYKTLCNHPMGQGTLVLSKCDKPIARDLFTNHVMNGRISCTKAVVFVTCLLTAHYIICVLFALADIRLELLNI